MLHVTVRLHGLQRLPLMVKILAPLTLIEMLISAEEWEESGGALVLEVVDVRNKAVVSQQFGEHQEFNICVH